MGQGNIKDNASILAKEVDDEIVECLPAVANESVEKM